MRRLVLGLAAGAIVAAVLAVALDDPGPARAQSQGNDVVGSIEISGRHAFSITSFHAAIENPGGTSTASLHPFVFSKRIDGATPALAEDAARHTPHARVTITITTPPDGATVIRYVLENVHVRA